MKKQTLCAILLMIGLALTRWPGLMPANFSAVYALIFCAAVYFPKRLAWCLILPVLLLTDILLNLHYGAPIFHIYMVPNYLSYACILWLGQQFSSGSSFIKLLGGGLLGPREISPKTQINIAKQASESPTSFLESTSQICVYLWFPVRFLFVARERAENMVTSSAPYCSINNSRSA